MDERFITDYDYHEIQTTPEMEPVYTDGYAAFGWNLETTEEIRGTKAVRMRFQRAKRLRNIVELTRLQYLFESCVKEIEVMERSKTKGAAMAAYATGLIGTGFVISAVLAVMAELTSLGIGLAIPGAVGLVAPYFLYRSIRQKKTEALEPLIRQKYDEIHMLCAKARCLWSWETAKNVINA